jgi:high affinity Mn2+ porin
MSVDLRFGTFVACALTLAGLNGHARAQSAPTPDQTASPAPPQATPAPELWAFHEQATFVEQYHPAFGSGLRGPNSLDPGSRGDETFDATLYAGVRPWAGAELWANAEVDQGFGLSNTLGVAAFPSAEAYKVGAADPYVRLPRLFFRQTLDLGGSDRTIDPDQNVLGGHETANRLVLWLGKFGVTDVFDTNDFAHDPRQDFFNWAVVDAGTFDYAADAWGYSYGAAAEWYRNWWTLRGGAFALSRVPNSPQLDTGGGQVQFDLEAEERHTLWGRNGVVKLTGFLNRGRMGDYDAAVAQAERTATLPSVAAVRQYASRAGISLDAQQALTDELSLFARAGIAEGGREVYEFTDTDKSLSAGASLQGKRWGRPDDVVGLATVVDDISRQFKNYLNAGGFGILVGDGALPRSGPEQVVEAYYSYAATAWAHITADYQFVNNPAYDRLRGPVSVLGIRLHVQY